MTHLLGHSESDRADRLSRALVSLAALAAIAALAHEHVQSVLAVPSLDAGLYREETAVLVEMRTPPVSSSAPRLKEHLTEKSDFKIAAKPQPEPEPPAKPELKPQPPERAEPLPQARPEANPQPKPKPNPKPKPRKEAQPQKPEAKPAAKPATEADAARSARSGVADAAAGTGEGKGLAGKAAGSAGDLRSQALAQILDVVEANKRYPRRARQTGQSGEVLLAVHVNGEGVVERVELRRKNASALLNRAASAAAKPLLGMKTMLAEPLTLEIPVKFELR